MRVVTKLNVKHLNEQLCRHQMFQSKEAPEKSTTPEEFIRMTKGITTATAKAVAAGNSARQEDVISTANLSRKVIADMLNTCKVCAYTCVPLCFIIGWLSNVFLMHIIESNIFPSASGVSWGSEWGGQEQSSVIRHWMYQWLYRAPRTSSTGTNSHLHTHNESAWCFDGAFVQDWS